MKSSRAEEIVEEIGMSTAVNLGLCSKSTAYRLKKEVNEILEREHYTWRVKLIIEPNQRMPYVLQGYMPAQTIGDYK